LLLFNPRFALGSNARVTEVNEGHEEEFRSGPSPTSVVDFLLFHQPLCATVAVEGSRTVRAQVCFVLRSPKY
jgi:hypothetical protein